MGVYKIVGSPFYYYSFKLPGHPQQRGSTGYKDRKLAQKKFDILKGNAQRRVDFAEPVDWTMNELIDWTWTNFWSRRPRVSRKDIDHLIVQFMKRFGARKAATIAVHEIRDYRAEREKTVSFSTTNKELSRIKFAFARAIEDKHLFDNPLATIKRTNEKSLKRNIVASAETQAYLFENAKGMFHYIVRFALASGLRKGEIEELKKSQIDWINREIAVSTWKGGIKRTRYIRFDIDPEIETILRKMDHPYEAVFHNGRGEHIKKYGLIHSAWPRLCAKMGIEGLTFHDLRHTFATELWRRTRNIVLVHDMLGHEKLETTMTYINLKKTDLVSGQILSKTYQNGSKVTEIQNADVSKIVDNQLRAVSSVG